MYHLALNLITFQHLNVNNLIVHANVSDPDEAISFNYTDYPLSCAGAPCRGNNGTRIKSTSGPRPRLTRVIT